MYIYLCLNLILNFFFKLSLTINYAQIIDHFVKKIYKKRVNKIM